MKVSTQQYAKTLLKLTENKTEKEISDVILRFADVLKKEGQMKNAGKIMEKFSEVYNTKHGIVEAGLISSRELSSDQVYQVEKFIKEKYKAKEVVIKNVVGKNIRGGIIIKVGDKIFDASIESQLKKLKKALNN